MAELPLAYMLEFAPGEPMFYEPRDYEGEDHRDGARVRGLFAQAQPGESADPIVFYSARWGWVHRKDAINGRCPTGFRPLFEGPVLHEPKHFASEIAAKEPWLLQGCYCISGVEAERQVREARHG